MKDVEDVRTDSNMYLNFHNNFLKVMRVFLKNKWSEELLELKMLVKPKKEKKMNFKRKSQVAQHSIARGSVLSKKNSTKRSVKETKSHVSRKRGNSQKKIYHSQLVKGANQSKKEGNKKSKKKAKLPPKRKIKNEFLKSKPADKDNVYKSEIIDVGFFKNKSFKNSSKGSNKAVFNLQDSKKKSQAGLSESKRIENTTLTQPEIEETINLKNTPQTQTPPMENKPPESPFDTRNQIERSETQEMVYYDLQIQNVVLSEEVRSDLGNEVMEMSINALRNVGKELLGNLLHIDSQYEQKANYAKKMNLQKIREMRSINQKNLLRSSGYMTKSKSKSRLSPVPNRPEIQMNNSALNPKEIKSCRKSKNSNQLKMKKDQFKKKPKLPKNLKKIREKSKVRNSSKQKGKKSFANFLSKKDIPRENVLTGKRSRRVKFSLHKKKNKMSRLKDERNKRKKVRIQSQKKFYKEMRQSLHKLSLRMTSIEKRKMEKQEFFKVTNQYDSSSSVENEVGFGREKKYMQTMSNIDNVIPERLFHAETQEASQISFGRDPMIQTISHFPRQIYSTSVSFENNFISELEPKPRKLKKGKRNSKKIQFKDEVIGDSIRNLKKKMVTPISELNKTTGKGKKKTTKKKQKSRKYENSETSEEISLEKKHEISNIYEVQSEEDEVGSIEDQNELQSGLPLNVSQSTSEHLNSAIRTKKKGYYNYDELTVFEIRNLKKNFNNFSSWFFVNKPQGSNIASKKVARKQNNHSSIPGFLNSYKDQKYTLLHKLSNDVDKKVVKGFLREIFGKFKAKQYFGEKEIGRAGEKFFAGKPQLQSKVMPMIYQLIDVEISIQSKQLNRLV